MNLLCEFKKEFECCECSKLIKNEIMFESDDTYICFDCRNKIEKLFYPDEVE